MAHKKARDMFPTNTEWQLMRLMRLKPLTTKQLQDRTEANGQPKASVPHLLNQAVRKNLVHVATLTPSKHRDLGVMNYGLTKYGEKLFIATESHEVVKTVQQAKAKAKAANGMKAKAASKKGRK